MHAEKLVENIESNNLKCFIAPRDIPSGSDYNETLIEAIDDCDIFILLYSESSIKSRWVLNEINSAASRNKIIINVKLENIPIAPKHEIYLGTSQWIDSFGMISLDCINGILNRYKELCKDGDNNKQEKNQLRELNTLQLEIVTVSEAIRRGMTPLEITMKENEIDFMIISPPKYIMNDEIEGTLEDWAKTIVFEEETSCLMLNNNKLVGYCDLYPIKDESYEILESGKATIKDDMIDIFLFGGTFKAWFSMLAVIPELDNQMGYYPMFDWFIKKLAEWKKKDIIITNVGLSCYTDTLEAILKKFSFTEKSINPANGKVFSVDIKDLRNNEIIKHRYKDYDI